MKKKNNHISDELLSEYLDNEVPEAECKDIEKHLGSCDYCRDRLGKFRQIREVSRQRPEPTIGRDLWTSIESQIDSLDKKTSTDNRFKKSISVIAIVLIVVAGGWMLAGNQFRASEQKIPSPATVNQYAFDYGLYLSGLSNPQLMQQFSKGYNRHKVKAVAGGDSVALKIRSELLGRLPKGFSMKSIYYLESACCRCTQFTLQHAGKEITVFKQPKKHPAEFTGYHQKHATIDSSDCSKVEAENHMALTFDAGDSRYVIVGSRRDPMLSTVMHKLNSDH